MQRRYISVKIFHCHFHTANNQKADKKNMIGHNFKIRFIATKRTARPGRVHMSEHQFISPGLRNNPIIFFPPNRHIGPNAPLDVFVLNAQSRRRFYLLFLWCTTQLALGCGYMSGSWILNWQDKNNNVRSI